MVYSRILNTVVRYNYHHFFTKRTTYVDPKGKDIRIFKPGRVFLASLVLAAMGVGLLATRETEKEIE